MKFWVDQGSMFRREIYSESWVNFITYYFITSLFIFRPQVLWAYSLPGYTVTKIKYVTAWITEWILELLIAKNIITLF